MSFVLLDACSIMTKTTVDRFVLIFIFFVLFILI